MLAASYKMTEMIPSTSAHLIDRSEDVIFELVWLIKRSQCRFQFISPKKKVQSVIDSNDAAYGLPKERWFRSMLFSVNTSRNPI